MAAQASAGPAAGGEAFSSKQDAPQEFFAGRQFTPEQRGVVDFFRPHLAVDGVSAAAANAAADWLQKEYRPDAVPQARTAHPYDLRSFGFTDGDLAHAHSFANAMAKAGASEQEVYALLRRYVASQSPSRGREGIQAARELERQDAADRSAARYHLEREWGADYNGNVAQIAAYLDRLPDAERERIETGTVAGGRLMLNDPATLNGLLQRARSAPAASGDIERRIAELEKLMRTDRPAYNKREAEYRQLLAQRGR